MINTQARLAILGYGTKCSKKNSQIAATIGKIAGKNGISLIAGNVTSTFNDAFSAAKDFQITNICVIEKHKKISKNHNATEIYYTKDTYSKHTQIAEMADAAILIGGGSGSQMLLNHFIKHKKTVIAIKGSGGIADKRLSKKVIVVKNPTEAIKTLFQTKNVNYLASPLGNIKLSYDHFALTGLQFVEQSITEELEKKKDPFAKQLLSYFKGKPVDFTGKIRLVGTEFQKTVWRAILDIPYGKTMEFGELATYLQKKHTDGAIAKIAFQNPIQIIIPSHRLNSKDGKLSKYPNGKEIKMKLLDLEKHQTEFSFF